MLKSHMCVWLSLGLISGASFMWLFKLDRVINLLKTYDPVKFREEYVETMPHLFPTVKPQNSSHHFYQDEYVVLKEPAWASKLKGQDIFIVFFVHSATTHLKQRDEIRKQFNELARFFNKRYFSKQLFTLTFVMGRAKNATMQQNLEKEYQKHRDFLMINTTDTYRNLPYKSLGFLNWVVSNELKMEGSNSTLSVKVAGTDGFKVRWMARMDDDHYVKADQLIIHLLGRGKPADEIICNRALLQWYPLKSFHPSFKKWYVSNEEWPAYNALPDYCMGWLYLMSPEVAKKLIVATYTAPYLWIEDAYISGLLRTEANVGLVSIDWTQYHWIFEIPLLALLQSPFIHNFVIE